MSRAALLKELLRRRHSQLPTRETYHASETRIVDEIRNGTATFARAQQKGPPNRKEEADVNSSLTPTRLHVDHFRISLRHVPAIKGNGREPIRNALVINRRPP